MQGKGAQVLGLIENYKGCPFACNYCAAKKRVLKKDTESTLVEIEHLYNLGIKRFYMIDLTFGIHKYETFKLLGRLANFKNQHTDFGFRCITRSDIITHELATSLKRAGCYEVGIGVETNSRTLLNAMNKKISDDVNKTALQILADSQITIKLFLIEGYPGSSTQTTLQTFELLTELKKRKSLYFVQPALSRDIMPHQQGFVQRRQSKVLRRGTTSQLDFRHDGREQGWNDDRSIRSMVYLMVAHPSTEISKNYADEKLAERCLLDMPFFVSRALFFKALENVRNDIEKEVLHLIAGVYTLQEIEKRIEVLHPNQNAIVSIKELLERLREMGFIDSIGRPNAKVQNDPAINHNSTNSQFNPMAMLFWNGDQNRYVYNPRGAVKRIKTSLYTGIPEEAFTYLMLASGYYSNDAIAHKLSFLFKGRNGFDSIKQAIQTTNEIEVIFRREGFLI